MWKEWTNVVLGIWLAVSPWIIGGAADSKNVGMVWNCVLTGLLIVAFAFWATVSAKEVWQEWVLGFLAVWLLIAPGTLSYNIPAVTWDNVIVGLAVGILAIWRASERKPTA